MCVYGEKEVYFKELTHMIMGLASPKCEWQASRLEIQGRVDTESKGSLEAEFSPLGWSSVFFSYGLQLIR